MTRFVPREMVYTVGLIGTGANPNAPDNSGFAMAYRHAEGYRRLDSCRITACADLVIENAQAFADRFGVPEQHVYTDYKEMVREVEPDIVSVCVPPVAHASIVIGCAESGVVKAIHCEKPMALTWGEAREMTAVAEANGVQLTFNHQRRFSRMFRKAKQILDQGRVGQLRRVEIGGENLYDYGSHLFDLCGFVTDQTPVEWVLAQIDYRDEDVRFGAHNENQAISHWGYDNGVHGLASTGVGSLLDCQMRLVGSEGVLEIGRESGPPLRLWAAETKGWTTVDTGGDDLHGPVPRRLQALAQSVAGRVPGISPGRFSSSAPTYIQRAIEDVVDSMAESRTSELDAENALQATELIFASWESARRRQRIDLPLEIVSNPLEEMVKDGVLTVSTDSATRAKSER